MCRTKFVLGLGLVRTAVIGLAGLMIGGCPSDLSPIDYTAGGPAANQVPDFSPRVNGFHFDNEFPPDTMYPAITLPIVGTIYSSDANDGLCDGFVLAVLDMFLREPVLTPPADTAPPKIDSPLFEYLAQREVDCWLSEGMPNFWKALEWCRTPSEDTVIETPAGRLVTRRGVAWRTVVEEWPLIKADIDAGRPSPLWLVTMPAAGVLDVPQVIHHLRYHHQVLAYGYELDDSHNLVLKIYEPQEHDSESVTIQLNISTAGDPLEIVVSSMPWALVRGFFRSSYGLRDASSIASEN